METITALEHSDATIYYHQDHKVVHAEFHASIAGQALKDILNWGVKLMEREGAVRWLSDNRQVPVLSEEDTEWINTVWIQSAIDVGWKYWALVVPEDIKARMNLNEIVQDFYNKGIRIMVFVDVDEAMNWLETVD